MRSLRWVGIGLAALCASCASDSSRRELPYSRPLGALAWRDMTGLTQDQIRSRLGLKRTDETFATHAVELDGGKVVAETPVRDLARRPCGRESKRVTARTEFSGDAILTFVNGRLSGVDAAAPDESLGANGGMLRATCVFEAAARPADPPVKRTAKEKVIAAVRWGMLAPERSEADQKTFEHWRMIGDLHLGATPPGGVDAWTRTHAETVTRETNGDVRVRIRSGGEVLLRNGLLIAIEPDDPSASCLLRSDMSLACDQKRYW